jgi:serine/threonine-protein kinase
VANPLPTPEPAPSEWTAGRKVRGDLELIAPLGAGASGRVWRVRHHKLDTDVAVKFLDERAAARPEARARFEREAAAAAQIKSPHVMQILDCDVIDGTPYIVMELFDGETLRQRLDRVGALSLPEVRTIMAQLCKGLEAAHRVGVVHRDIKPDNIFLADTAGGLLLKIFDFGIAKRPVEGDTARLTAEGTMIGTPRYMSPEQFLDAHEVDRRADLWAAAVIAYEMLAAEHPFKGNDVGAVCAAMMIGKFAPITSVVSGLPIALDAWFEQAFRRSPAQRFSSALELARAFLRSAPAPADELEDALVGASDGESAGHADVLPASRLDQATLESPLVGSHEREPELNDSASSGERPEVSVSLDLPIRNGVSRRLLVLGGATVLALGFAVLGVLAFGGHSARRSDAPAASPSATETSPASAPIDSPVAAPVGASVAAVASTPQPASHPSPISRTSIPATSAPPRPSTSAPAPGSLDTGYGRPPPRTDERPQNKTASPIPF